MNGEVEGMQGQDHRINALEDKVQKIEIRRPQSRAQYTLILGVGVVMILVTLLAVIYFLFTQGEMPLRPRFYIVMSLLLFALSTIGALLFTTSANIDFDMKLITIGMSGPAVLWFACLILFHEFVEEENWFSPLKAQFEDFPLLLENYHQSLGWSGFEPWRTENERFDCLMNEERKPTLAVDFRDRLVEIAHRQHPESAGLDDVKVRTLFVYVRDKRSEGAKNKDGKAEASVFKLQSISGTKPLGEVAVIPFRSTVSSTAPITSNQQSVEQTPGAEVPEVILPSIPGNDEVDKRENVTVLLYAEPASQESINVKTIVESDPPNYFSLKRLQKIEVFIVTWYRDFDVQDYLIVDTRSFVNTETNGGKATERYLGALSDIVIEKKALWLAKNNPVPISPSDVPLIFAPLSRANSKDYQPTKANITGWFSTGGDENQTISINWFREIEMKMYDASQSTEKDASDVALSNLCQRILDHTPKQPPGVESRCSLTKMVEGMGKGEIAGYNATEDRRGDILVLLLKLAGKSKNCNPYP